MAKGPSKPQEKNSTIDSDMDKYARATSAKPDTKVIILAIVFLVVFGLMAVFLMTTNQNTDTGGQLPPGATLRTAPNAVKAP